MLGPPPARPAHSPVCLLGNTPSPASQRTPEDCREVGLQVLRFARLPGNTQSSALDSSVDSRSASACLSTMVFRVSSFPESYSSPSETSTQPRRPSVKWDLGSDYEDVTEETTASGSDFRRERLESQPDLGLHIQPQIYFLRPRSPIPKLLFRCGSGVQSSCQTRYP